MKMLYCFDMRILLSWPEAGVFNLWNLLSKPEPFGLAQEACIRMSKRVDIVLLDDGSNKGHEYYINRDAYMYIYNINTNSEFEMFRDRFFPAAIYSNIPNKWDGVYSDVFQYPEGCSDFERYVCVFNHVRRDIKF